MSWPVASVLMFAACFALVGVLHVRGHQEGAAVPSVGVAMGWVMRTTTGRVITLVFWCWVGFHFFAR